MSEPGRLSPRGELWRDREFLKLWAAQAISQVGTQATLLALPLAAILVLDATATEVALLGAEAGQEPPIAPGGVPLPAPQHPDA